MLFLVWSWRWLVYGAGMAGWILGSFMLLGGWVAILVLKAADPGAAAVQALSAVVTMGLALRWVFRHTQLAETDRQGPPRDGRKTAGRSAAWWMI